MNRSLNSFPFCSVHKTKLKKAGYEFISDLNGVSKEHLSKEIAISLAEATEILRIVNESISKNKNKGHGMGISLGGISAFDLLAKEEMAKRIITFSQRIDEMLGGGVPVCKITEICGSPGIGKTQLCLQLAVDATIPSVFGGAGGETVYIDTEGSFVTERVTQIAQAAAKHILYVAESSNNTEMKEKSTQFTVEYALSRIHYYRCHTYLQLIALTNILHSFISEHPSVCLVIIDSIASPFRHGFKDLSHRNRLLSGISQALIKLAIEQELAVVLTNQMTTRVDTSSSNNESRLVPALGDSWGHAATIRIMLYWEEEQRCAFLFKSPSCQEMTVRFQITGDGVRDIQSTNDSSLQCDPAHFPFIPTQSVKEDSYKSFHENDDELESFFQDASAYLDFDHDNTPISKRPRIAETSN